MDLNTDVTEEAEHWLEMKKIKGYKREYIKVIKEIKELCLDYYKERLISLVVFGSIAKRSFSPVSDIDLLVVLKDKKNQYKEYADYFDNVESKLSFAKDFHPEINPIFKSYRQLNVKTPYLWNTEFIILYDRDDFFKKFINKLERFKKTSIIIHNQGMEYIEVLSDQ